MNFSVPDSVLGRQRCRQWMPLVTQQLRLRHLYQVMAYNVSSRCGGSFYYTLHLTTMCAPFYTSEKSDSFNPKWAELDMSSLPYPSVSAFVLRIWQAQNEDADVIITTWAINLSGLAYLGTKLSEIQPECFMANSVIFHLRGGFFASGHSLRRDLAKPLQFIDHLNIVSTELDTKLYRNVIARVAQSEVKQSYVVSKLQRLHSLQIVIKNQRQNVETLHEKILNKCGLCHSTSPEPEAPSPVHRHSQLLTMTTLNKMLQWQGKPTKLQRQRIANVSKSIEIARFRIKLLAHERDRKSAQIRQLNQNYSGLLDANEERGSLLMENYHKLSRETEKLKEMRKEQIQLKELFLHTNTQLQHRRRQLMSQLLFIYPIMQLNPQKCLINGVYLPDSEMLSDCSDGGLAVGLGYVAHVLLMCSFFLQVPLRYPITFFGSRSNVVDHITATLADKDRTFPLYTKGKDRMQFNYAVYLLNKDVAQLRWLCGLHTPDLRATLPNLLSLLQGRDKDGSFRRKRDESEASLCPETADAVLDSHEHQEKSQSPPFRVRKRSGAGPVRSAEARPGLSEILAIPEAFMNQQISHNDFRNYISSERLKQKQSERRQESDTSSKVSTDQKSSDHALANDHREHPASFDSDSIEQGTDILHSSLNLAQGSDMPDSSSIVEEHPKAAERLLKQNRRISRSVGSIAEEGPLELHAGLELGSDPLLNLSSEPAKAFGSKNLGLDALSVNLEDGQQEFLQKWLDSGPALVCSEESLYPDEILGTAVAVAPAGSTESPLTLRTDALLSTTSFNLIKPK